MRIAMMTNNYKPFVGGVPISVERLTEGLRMLGHEVCVFAPEYEEDSWEMDVIRYRSRKRRMANGMAVPDVLDPRIREEFAWRNFDVIHVHHPMLIGNVAAHLSRKYRIPLVYTYHTRYEEYLHYLGGTKGGIPGSRCLIYQGRRLIPYYMESYLKHCSMVIAPSQDMKDYLYTRNISTPVRVLPTGLSDEAYTKAGERSEELRKQYLQGRDYLLCTVSRLDQEKNLYFLLEAVGKLYRQMGDRFRMMFVGDGAEREGLERAAREMGLGAVVSFVGAVENARVKEYLSASDAFLFASKSETQGIVLAEAMAAGLPVVAVEACGVRDIVENERNGVMMKEDPDLFADKAAEVLLHPRLREYLSEGAKKTAEHYRMDRIAEGAQEVYRTAIARERSLRGYEYEAYEKNHTVSSLLRLFKVS